MKPYNVLQEEFPEKIRKLIMDGFYDAEPEERGFRFETLFYNEYETMLCDMQMNPLPVDYIKQTNRFQILPQFWENTTGYAMSSYYKIFYQRYRDIYIEKQDDPDIDEEDNALLFGVDYRTTNEEYAIAALKKMTGQEFEPKEKIDDYGWIENRKHYFYEFMDELCDTYKLPLLPIDFNTEDHLPRFAVSPQEAKNFMTIFHSRRKVDEEYDAVKKEMTFKLARLENDLPVEEKEIRQKNIHLQHASKVEKISNKAEKKWQAENRKNHFPSQLDFYPIQIVRQIDENKDCTLKANKAVKPEEDFMAYLPFQPILGKNGFIMN